MHVGAVKAPTIPLPVKTSKAQNEKRTSDLRINK
jgi:hypothetical protein